MKTGNKAILEQFCDLGQGYNNIPTRKAAIGITDFNFTSKHTKTTIGKEKNKTVQSNSLFKS